MMNVYQECPKFEDQKYLLRFVTNEDCADLLKVYSDRIAVPFFNSDNCGGDDFYYTTLERMKRAIDYWHSEYDRNGFVRWTIIDKTKKLAVGTIELFNRSEKDYFTNCGLLRLDLRSDYETTQEIGSILALIVPRTYDLFECDKVATKAKKTALQRIDALTKAGFRRTDEKLVGHDGTKYDAYYVTTK
jgi:[ribosomal protein S5]-alanine N-acetyltransferase